MEYTSPFYFVKSTLHSPLYDLKTSGTVGQWDKSCQNHMDGIQLSICRLLQCRHLQLYETPAGPVTVNREKQAFLGCNLAYSNVDI